MAWGWDITFEVAFAVDPANEPAPGDWVDLSSRLERVIDLTRGRPRGETESATESSLWLENRDRVLDPTNPAAPYNLVAMRHARLTVTVGAATYKLFRGYVEAWPPVWPGFNDGLVRVDLVDGSSWVALQNQDVDLPAQAAGARLGALLDAAGWPAARRDIDPGPVLLEAYEQDDANLWRIMQDTADADDGHLYVSAAGDIVYRDRHGRLDAASTMTAALGAVPFQTVQPVWDVHAVTNIARVELEDGDVYAHEDPASVAQFGPRSLPIRDLPLRAAEAEGLAQWTVVKYADQHLWFDQLQFQGRMSGVFPAVPARELGDLVTVQHPPTGGGALVDVDLHIERIHHVIGKGTWVVELDLSPYLGAGPWMRWNDLSTGFWTAGNKWAP